MRDPERIDKFCKELAQIWKDNCPDWRFGQLIENVFNYWISDPFYMEEDKMIQTFKDYFSSTKEEEDNNELGR